MTAMILTRRTRLTLAACCALLIITGCDYDAPITAAPTRNIEPALTGEWTGTEWTDHDCKDRMRIRRLDGSSYILTFNDAMYRAWHSDVDGAPFVTVQQLDSEGPAKYAYYVWSLSPDGERLTLRAVHIDKKATRDSSTVVKTLREGAGDAKILGDAATFTKRHGQ